MSVDILQTLTDRIILHHYEKIRLRNFAAKITKVPDKIVIPGEYLGGEK